MDLFEDRAAKTMEIGRTEQAFDDAGFYYEIKLDGERCLAYLDETGVDLLNRRGHRITSKMPELLEMHKQVDGRCILDGELVVTRDGKPDFEEIKRRASATSRQRIQLLAKQSPVTFVVFDILYLHNQSLVGQPLSQRKQTLAKVVREDAHITLARYIEGEGIALFESATQHGLEGIVCKRKNSVYQMGKRTNDWIKCKNIQDDDYIICGYIREAEYVASLVLGQYDAKGQMVYKGHVTLALSSADFAQVAAQPKAAAPPFRGELPPGNQNATWLVPGLVCTVEFMHIGAGGLMRHPVYKTLRADKPPGEVVVPA